MSETTGKLFTWLFLISVFVIVFYVGEQRVTRIRKHKKIVSGYVYETSSARNGVNVSYSFNIDGKEFDESVGLDITSNYQEQFLNKWFPVVYNAKDPNENCMLIAPDDFKRYGVSFPDSLDWVTDYIQ